MKSSDVSFTADRHRLNFSTAQQTAEVLLREKGEEGKGRGVGSV